MVHVRERRLITAPAAITAGSMGDGDKYPREQSHSPARKQAARNALTPLQRQEPARPDATVRETGSRATQGAGRAATRPPGGPDRV